MPTITIPNPTLLTVDAHTVGPVTVSGTWTSAALLLDPTIPGGLNSLTTATTIAFEIDQSTDGGATWLQRATGGVAGGPTGDGTPGMVVTFSPPLSSGLVRASAVVTGTSVEVAGTLVVT